jgi:hypothetical protein
MTEHEWLEQTRRDAFNLTYLIDSYHPASYNSAAPAGRDPRKPGPGLPITAPNAESASNAIRQKIRDEADGKKPAIKFKAALESGDTGTLMSLLNQAWFGVPESTSCWGIRGFSEAVRLLEDPPEPEEETGDQND